jgi:hypothetical protein
MEDNPDEYHVGTREEQCVKCTCLRRTASLKPGMSDNNAEFNEEKSLKVKRYFEFLLYVHTPAIFKYFITMHRCLTVRIKPLERI